MLEAQSVANLIEQFLGRLVRVSPRHGCFGYGDAV